jgi:nucleobase:cation symporter-1, NCS1 family
VGVRRYRARRSVVNYLVDLTGKPSVRYGIPYAVMARASMGVRGATFPALIRGIVAIFWYGAQTYFASTAVALALNALLGNPGGPTSCSAAPCWSPI